MIKVMEGGYRRGKAVVDLEDRAKSTTHGGVVEASPIPHGAEAADDGGSGEAERKGQTAASK